jgi:hypothetical protein
VYVVDPETRAEAERFIAADPYSRVDLFEPVTEGVTIARSRNAYFDGECFFSATRALALRSHGKRCARC